MKKNILMALSGGYDSTYLLVKNLEDGNDVYPMYIFESFIHSIKQKIENEKVKSLVGRLQKKYKNLHDLRDVHMKMNPINNLISTQPIAWIINLFSEVKRNEYSIKFDEVQIGYIKSDCAIDYIPTIRNIWKALFSFSTSYKPINVPQLRFPLSRYTKKYIIEKLRSYDKNVLALCWTCENPKIIKTGQSKGNSIEVFVEACGSCNPCNNLKRTKTIPFNTIRKYKATFNYKNYLNDLNNNFKKIKKYENIQHINPGNISIKYANKKTINKIKKDKLIRQ